MVIGYEKEGRIANEPLLEWYHELFKEILNVRNQTLVVVGYGFMDHHINNIIADAGKNGLKLHVISPDQPSQFKKTLYPLHGVVTQPYDPWSLIYRAFRKSDCFFQKPWRHVLTLLESGTSTVGGEFSSSLWLNQSGCPMPGI